MKPPPIDLVVISLCLLESVLLTHCDKEILFNKSKISGCYSPNDTAVFMCTVIDANHYYATQWSGTIFNCPSANSISNNKIFLPHMQSTFVARGTCNAGTIVAEGTEVNGSLYTSTLTIAPVTPDMNGQTIICSVSGITVIGTEILRVGVTPEAPFNTSLSFTIPSQTFTVSWTDAMGIIGGVGGYHTSVSGDCGQCSNIGAVSANVTDMSCSGWDPIGQTCNISIYTITADCHFRSESPAFAVVHLTLPKVPTTTSVIPTYDLSGGLLRIATTFIANQEIADENGFTIKYVIVYTHSSLGSEPVEVLLDCASRTECAHVLNVHNSHGEYSIATGAVTPVGKASQQDNSTITIGINTFVRVTVHVLQRFTVINCFFLNKHNHISCEIEYGQDCNTLAYENKKNGASINESDVAILLNDVLPSTQYCFVLTAENQTYTVKIQGQFTGYRAESILSTIIITSVTIIVALVSLITLTATVIVCYKKKKSLKGDDPVDPVYYSAVKPVAEEVTPDPNYDVISAVKTRKDITTEANEAYHPVSVQPNEAYQTKNIMQPNEAYQTTNITNVN